MNLRASSGEWETKNRCTVAFKYKQRFFAVHGHLISLNSCSTTKMSLPKAAIRLSNRLQKIGEVVNCSVLSAPNSRAAVSLSYLVARASSECWKNVKCCDRPGGQPSVNVILFRLQTLSHNGLGKS